MEIRYTYKPDMSYVEDAVFLWRKNQGKGRRNTMLIGLMGLFFLALGILFKRRTDPVWNFLTSMGIAYLIIYSSYFYQFYKLKRGVIRNAQKLVTLSQKDGSSYEWGINDEMVAIRDKSSYCEFGWSCFSAFDIQMTNYCW